MAIPLVRAICRIRLVICVFLAGTGLVQASQGKVLGEEIEVAMKRATRAMVEKVAVKGGYVWSYLPDFSRRWGELEAKASMIWIQSPGTPGMGQLFLDAYHATGDEYYYQAAEEAAGALAAGQHASGGWNYVVDFAGEESLKQWYATVGRNAWRLEEFQHYQGNATFDDGCTAEAAKFLLRLYAEKRDERHRAALERAIGFVLASQHASGAWPQRFPKAERTEGEGGGVDYAEYLTLNDGVTDGNIEFLLLCEQVLGGERFREPVRRAMESYLLTQQPAPQPGWALQFTLDLKPAGARTYEPTALATHATARAVEQLMRFYRMTGEEKFLARIPEALDWLDAVKLPEGQRRHGATHPTFVEVGTGRTLYLHRTGSNVWNGRYYADYDPRQTIIHYSSTRQIDTAGLRARYENVRVLPREEMAKGLPQFFTARQTQASELDGRDEGRVREIVGALNADGFWPTPLGNDSHLYCGDGSKDAVPGDFTRTFVGDESDTSPFGAKTPVLGISTKTYIRNMAALIEALESRKNAGGVSVR